MTLCRVATDSLAPLGIPGPPARTVLARLPGAYPVPRLPQLLDPGFALVILRT